MKTPLPIPNCQNCSCKVDDYIVEYALEHYGFALCTPCQTWLKEKLDETSQETICLYLSLRTRNVPAVLEKSERDNTTDIAVASAKVNIEVDGPQYLSNPNQALYDLQKTYQTFKKGYLTLRIPHMLVKKNLDETADYITAFLNAGNSNN